MTPTGMAALRIAATLVHALPGLRVRIRHGGTTLVEVAPVTEATGSVVGACAFRRAVANAHERSKRGVRMGLVGLPEGTEPTIDIGVRPGDAVLPGGIYRVVVGGNTVHGFATTLPAQHCRDQLPELDEDGRRIRLHHDAATEVTFVHTVAPAGEPHGTADLEHLLGVLLADEILHDLAVASG